jgi:MFS family permease
MATPASAAPTEAAPSAWAPLAQPVFRMLWITWLVSNVCLWMNDVAAAWLMTSLTASPAMVALVQTASTLPVFLLGLPSGALADILNRRLWFIATQFWVAANAVVLSAMLLAGWLSPGLLLLMTFGNGIGLALRWPVYAAIVPELVPRRDLPAALALNGVAVNTSRIIGPLIAGAILAGFGGVYVFLANAVLSLAAAVIVMRWRSEQKVSVLPGERFVGAMRVGVQYVAQSRPMRVVLARVALFFLQSTPLLALLPIVAKRLQGGAGTFTVLLAALGVGAIVAVAVLPRLRMRMTRDRMVRDGSIAQAIAMAVVGFAPNLYVALPAMLIAGAAWITVANTLTVSAQLALPDWVRARGMAIYQMALMGAAAAGAALSGQVAEWADVPTALAASAATGLVALIALRRLSVGADADIDLTPARLLDEPEPAFPIEHDQGPVLVTIEYEIDPARAEEFAAVMRETRANRLQKGALSWGLFHDTSRPSRYLEYFLDESWADHLRRFERMTAADLALRERRHAFHIGPEPPKVTRYVAESIAR